MKTCEMCNQAKTKTGWCPGCAKNCCPDCWPQHVPQCFNEQANKCHQCRKKIRTVTSVEDMSGITIQAMTGRVFCGEKCFSKHLRSEGF